MTEQLNDDELNCLAELIDTRDPAEFLAEWRDGQRKKVVVYAWSDAWSLFRRLLNLVTWRPDL